MQNFTLKVWIARHRFLYRFPSRFSDRLRYRFLVGFYSMRFCQVFGRLSLFFGVLKFRTADNLTIYPPVGVREPADSAINHHFLWVHCRYVVYRLSVNCSNPFPCCFEVRHRFCSCHDVKHMTLHFSNILRCVMPPCGNPP